MYLFFNQLSCCLLLQNNGSSSNEILAQLQESSDDEGEEDEEMGDNDERGGVKYIEDVQLEIIDGNKKEKWLVINEVHIAFKYNEWKSSVVWRCSGRRRLGCPFSIVTTKPSEAGGPPKALRMSDPETHTCSADKIAPLMQKFRSKLAKRMQEELDLGWSKIWNVERALLLESLKDNPPLLQQVMLEMRDVETFRKTAQRARGKMVPKIPTEHKYMDPEKVCFDIFCNVL